ncbi:MAG: hydroxymethylbilane synthase [Bdellovibrionia bacterium]
MKTKLTLGTRKSLLAWAQSQWVANQVEKLNPGVQVELFGIETRGDKIVDVSLQKVEGKEFFVAEIDEALLSKKVDFTVHSLKDLSLDRPQSFAAAATPKRENPRDVVLFGPQALSRLKAGKTLKIGTSSPRRIENIPGFLQRALPRVSSQSSKYPDLDFVEIRGNVNTRLSRVQEGLESPKYLDGVVLAFAGIIRLWANPAGQVELKRLLAGVRWMVLPLKECPAAPGQGALAIECRADDEPVKKILRTLHHEQTARSVAAERQLLADWGGGCHQKFGATSFSPKQIGENRGEYELGPLLYIRGEKPDGTKVSELRWNSPQLKSQGPSTVRAWDGSQWREKAQNDSSADSSLSIETQIPVRLDKKSPIFVAHSRALISIPNVDFQDKLENARIWTSGTASWFRLAERGYWVEGCAEGLGFDELSNTLKEPVLRLNELKQWTVLTHSKALAEWSGRGFPALSTYTINSDYGNDAKSALKAASHVFLSSGSQYDELKDYLPAGIVIACGPGNTATKLRGAGLNPFVFPGVEEWKKWLKI